MAQTNYTIGKKLFLSFGAAIAASLVLAAITFSGLSRISASVDDLVDHSAKKQILAAAINLDLVELISIVRGVEVRGFMKDIPAVEKYHQSSQKVLARLNEHLTELSHLVSTPEGTTFVNDVTTASPHLAEAGDQIAQKAIAGDMVSVVAIYHDQFLPITTRLSEQAAQYVTRQDGIMADTAKSSRAIVLQSYWFTMITVFLCIAIGAVVIYIVRQINHDLRYTVTSLSEGAEQIAAAAGQVSSSSQTLAQGASEQAASIEETSASTEEINSMARRNTENSNSTAAMVSESQARFEETNHSLTEMVSAMDGISASSEQISRIIKVIDQIAFQTNILALNAAVEAARAGDAGMGFAVVADEVRNLARRSAEAAKDTATLIEDSIAKSRDGMAKVSDVANAIRSITAESSKMKLLVDEINLGSQEQSKGIDQISRAIQQMEKVTQSNAASAQQSAAAAEQLTAQSQSVKEIVANLSTLIGSEDDTHHSSISPHRISIRPQITHKTTPIVFKSKPTPLKTTFTHTVQPKAHAVAASSGSSKFDARASFPLDDEEFKEF